MLFSDEQKLLLKGDKKGFVKNTKLDFYEMLTKPRMKAIKVDLGKEVYGDCH
jgi:hypothetical protein